jgi:RNA polymerase sigma-70 factor, ECF subfamily
MTATSVTFDGCAIPSPLLERAARELRRIFEKTGAHSAASELFSGPGSILKQPVRELVGNDHISTADLVISGKSGDDDAKASLIERYQGRMAGFVLGCVGERHAVDDLCQTIFCKMLVALPRLKENDKFESWLFRIARNACFDYLRRQRLRRILIPWHADAEQVPAPEPASDENRIETFRRALMNLPRNQRELIALLQDDQMTYEQLAAITNSSVSSVKSRLFRARRTLRKVMREDD